MTVARARRMSLSLLFAAAAWAQTDPAFEVASVKKADPLDVNTVTSGQMNLGMTIDAARVDIRALSLTELLRMAYKVKTFQISGPAWLGIDRFDINAKMPPGATRDQVPEMVQALLAERFGLTLHRSTTEQSVYALTVVRSSSKLRESPPDSALPAAAPATPTAPAPTDGGPQVHAVATSTTKGVVTSSGPNGTVRMIPAENGMRLELTKMNTAGMVEILGRFVDRPVVDMTGLKGRYDVTLDVGMEDLISFARGSGVNVPLRSPSDSGRASEPGSSSIFGAIEPYGLKLEPRRAAIELLVIDHVERNPTEN